MTRAPCPAGYRNVVIERQARLEKIVWIINKCLRLTQWIGCAYHVPVGIIIIGNPIPVQRVDPRTPGKTLGGATTCRTRIQAMASLRIDLLASRQAADPVPAGRRIERNLRTAGASLFSRNDQCAARGLDPVNGCGRRPLQQRNGLYITL